MKNVFFRLFTPTLLLGFLATSCGDDPDPAPGQDLKDQTYCQENLTMSSNGANLEGKMVTLKMETPGKATLELSGEPLDLKAIIGEGLSAIGLPEEINTCGVLPGSPTYSLPVTLEGTPDNCTFSGNAESEYCTFSYSGTINADALTLDLKDVKLKDTTLAGSSMSLAGSKWVVSPASSFDVKNEIWINWDTTKPMDFMGSDYEIENFIIMALGMYPLVQGQTIAAILPQLLQEIEFCEDGNIRAKIVDAANGGENATLSPTNLAQYIVKGEQIIVYLNPQAIISANATTKADANPLQSVVGNLVSQILPMATNGIALDYSKSKKFDAYGVEEGEKDYPGNITVYLGTDILKPLLQSLMPLLQDESIKELIINGATSDPTFGKLAGMIIPNLLRDLPEIVEKTSTLEIGLCLTAAK